MYVYLCVYVSVSVHVSMYICIYVYCMFVRDMSMKQGCPPVAMTLSDRTNINSGDKILPRLSCSLSIPLVTVHSQILQYSRTA